MADPSDADLAGFDLREERKATFPCTLGEERRDEHAGQEIALVPIRAGTQTDVRRLT